MDAAYRYFWIASRFPTPAVPERVAPASRQSKWAGPRVSALGTALATAPFLVEHIELLKSSMPVVRLEEPEH